MARARGNAAHALGRRAKIATPSFGQSVTQPTMRGATPLPMES